MTPTNNLLTTTDFAANIAKNLTVALALRKMSRADLEKKTGISQPTISRYARGVSNIGAYELFLIARTLNYPMHYFFSESPKVFLEAE